MKRPLELSISCDDCVRRGTPDCEDCLVSFVLGEEPGKLAMTSEEAHVVELFSAQGMIPRLRYERTPRTYTG
ncbi:MAG: hypothetical protein WAN30_03760 [Acidimicrobiales bacterium]